MDFSEGAARATVAVCDWTGVFCLGFVIASTWYPYAVVPVVSARERSTLQCVWHSLGFFADGYFAHFCSSRRKTCGLEGQELSHASTHSINHERWWHSGYDLVRGADDDLRWVRPTPGIHCVYEIVQSKSGSATKRLRVRYREVRN